MGASFDDISSLLDSVLSDDTEQVTETPEPEEEVVITADDLVNEPEVDDEVDDIESLIAQAAGEQEEEPEPEVTEVTEVTETHTVCDTPSNQVFAKGTGVDHVPIPTFTDEDILDQIDIRQFGTLVTLRTARWHGKIKDRKASKDAAAAAGADAAAFETHKYLLAGADERLKKVHKCIDAARTAHYAMTLPWSVVGVNETGKRAGPRLLPNTLFMEYTAAVANAKSETEAALTEFEKGYANDLQAAQRKLGTAYNANDYPDLASIRDHFGLDFDFQPIPKGADFDGIQGQQAQKLAEALNSRTRTMLENAMQDAWQRLFETVNHAFERLSNPDALFHYTMVDKLKDQASMLKHLNATNDAKIEEIREAVEKKLTMYDVKDIRKDDALRKQLAKDAGEIVEAMKEYADA